MLSNYHGTFHISAKNVSELLKGNLGPTNLFPNRRRISFFINFILFCICAIKRYVMSPSRSMSVHPQICLQILLPFKLIELNIEELWTNQFQSQTKIPHLL